MRNIMIKIIPDSKQRYETSGDYWIDKRGTIQVRISKSKNRRYEALLLIHELTEMLLCIDRGVSLKAIDRFDMTFKGAGEPGDDPKAPYHREHRFATRIERLLARELRVNWAKYEAGLQFFTMKYKGRERFGSLQWDAPPSLDAVERALLANLGKPIKTIGDLDV